MRRKQEVKQRKKRELKATYDTRQRREESHELGPSSTGFSQLRTEQCSM